MQKIGILIETKDGKPKNVNFGVITASRNNAADTELYALLLDGKATDCKSVLQSYGIHKVVEITSHGVPLAWNPVSWSRAIIHAMQHFTIDTLVGLTSNRGKELLPRVAALLDAPLIMDCTAVNLAEHVVQKSRFSGRAVATLKTEGIFHIYGIRPNAVEAMPAPAEAEAVSFAAVVEKERLTVKAIKQSAPGGTDLSEADVIFSGGRGMENPENFRILFECAQVIDAAVGASRVAVDAGWVPYAMQVGQTGKTVSPKVYIACGISGSVQHFAGMKTAGLIIAINRDRDAAIMKQCDYFAVADLFEIIPVLTKKLKATSRNA